MTKSEARAFINSLVTMRGGATDEQAEKAPAVYPTWKEDVVYTVGERILYNEVLYKVLQDHQAQTDWAPDAAPSLFAKVLIPDADVIPAWEQPDSTNPYMIGDKVIYNGSTWICTIDGNVWEPGIYGWEQVI